MISLIATVLNEEKNIRSWLASLLRQTKLPDEIVIVDGGSTDQTWTILQEVQSQQPLLKIFQHPGNIASGRNYAIQQAQGDLIVVTDAGCFYEPTWLEVISQPLISGQTAFSATAFGPWLALGDNLIKYLIASATTPQKAEFGGSWLPSSRSVAFTKELWQKVGGYPEWLPICEDVIFDLKVIKSGQALARQNKPLVFWSPRPNLTAYFKQLFKYTRSDGHGKLWLNRQLIRYFVYLISLILLVLIFGGQTGLVLVLLAGGIIYLAKFWQRFLVFSKNKNWFFKAGGLVLLPLVIVWGDLAKMSGWPVGVWQRWTGKIFFQRF